MNPLDDIVARPGGSALGAEIRGIDLSQPLDDPAPSIRSSRCCIATKSCSCVISALRLISTSHSAGAWLSSRFMCARRRHRGQVLPLAWEVHKNLRRGLRLIRRSDRLGCPEHLTPWMLHLRSVLHGARPASSHVTLQQARPDPHGGGPPRRCDPHGGDLSLCTG